MNASELYDLRTADFGADLPLISRLATQFGPSILELACGTGRVLRHLMADGFEPVGVDLCPEALAVAASDCPSLRLEQQCMTRFEMEQVFDLIIVAFNSLECLLTLEEKLAMLRRVLDHSHSETRVFVDTYPYNFTPEDAALELPRRHIRTLTGHAGEPVDVFFSARRSPVTRCSNGKMLYRWTDTAGTLHETVHEYTVSLVTADELRMMLQMSGFAIECWHGDHTETPYKPGTHAQLNVVARALYAPAAR